MHKEGEEALRFKSEWLRHKVIWLSY